MLARWDESLGTPRDRGTNPTGPPLHGGLDVHEFQGLGPRGTLLKSAKAYH